MRPPWSSRRALEALGGRLESLEARLKNDVAAPVARLEPALRRVERTVSAPRLVAAADPAFLALADEIIAEGRTLLDRDRLHVLWQAAANAEHLGLPAVEIGVFRGGSAAFLARALAAAGAPGLPMYVFDSFVGHLEESISEFDPHHRVGLFGDTSFEGVREYLSAHPGVEVHATPFPAAIAVLPEGGFSLLHLDTDLYEPTLGALAHFRDRMPPGAVIVVDDYRATKTGGVLRAVREFLATKPPFQIWDFGTEQIVLVRRVEAGSGGAT